MISSERILRFDTTVTGVFVAVSAAGVAAPDTAGTAAAVFDVVCFVVGCVAFFAAFLAAVERSRTEQVTVTGVFLAAAAPAQPRRVLLGALGIQALVAVAAAAARPYTRLAFAVLVPMLGMGLAGLWTAHHGIFPPRESS